MAIVTAPRSASDATRFTPTTPHADSKSSSAAGGLRPARSAAAASPSAPGRSGPFRRAAGRDAPAAAPPGGAHHSGRPGGGGGGGETPEQRVARLRAAHLRAQNASVSRFDKIVAGGRRVFDSAHHVTVVGLLGFTALAALVTGYTAFDMMMYNRQRKAEFLAAQRKMQADSLEAARLAYMTGKATEEQVLLVEEANEREERAATRIFKLPALLGAPTPLDDKPAVEQQPPPPPPPPPPKVSDVATWPGAADAGTRPEQKPGGIFAWFSTRPRQAEQTTDAAGDTRPRSSGQVDETSGIPGSSGLAQAAGEKQQQAYVRTKAREAFEQEKQNQRTGGPLDRVGLDDGDQSQTSKKKKGWLW